MAVEDKIIITAEDRATSSIKSVEKSVGSLSATMAKVGAGLSAFGAIGALMIKDFVNSAMESQKAEAQLNAVLASTKGIAGVTAESVKSLASSLQKVTTFSDEEVMSGENLLLTFTKIGKDVFPDATKTMLDMSTALGQDMKSSAIQLGKALQDPILGVTALRRVGVNFGEAEQKMIEKMVKANDIMGAQKFILNELKTEFGGSAEALGLTFGGQMIILKNSFDDIKEQLGNDMIPILNVFNEILQKTLEFFKGLPEPVRQFGAFLLLAATGLALIAGPALLAASALATLGISISGLLLFTGVFVAIAAALALLYEAWINDWGGIQEKTDSVVKAIMGFITPLASFFAEQFGQIAQIAVETWNKISADWDAFMAVYGEQVRAAWEFVKSLFFLAFDAIKIAFTLLWENIKLIFKIAWEVFAGMIKVALKLLQGDWSGAWEEFKKTFTNIWDAIKTAFNNVWENMKAIAKNAIEYVKTLLKDILSSVMSVVDAITGMGAIKAGRAQLQAQTKANGGFITPMYAQGGAFAPRGTDTVPAMLTPGELVLNASQQRNLAGKLGGRIEINIYGNISSKEIAEEYGDLLVRKLKLSNAIT